MKLSNKELIIFDFDGTLIDSAPDLALSVNYMLKSIGRAPFDENTIRSWVGNGAQTLVRRGLSGSAQIDDNIDEVLFEKALDIFLKFYAENVCIKTVLYPKVVRTLKILKEQNYRMAIVTNKPFDFIEPILKGLDLEGYFELNLGGDTLERKKPDPLPLNYVCEKLSVSIEKTLMIGDSKNDIIAANAAQMQSIGVTYGYNYGEDIGLYKPTFVVDDFSDIVGLLAHES